VDPEKKTLEFKPSEEGIHAKEMQQVDASSS
jgi:hypothetical protein